MLQNRPPIVVILGHVDHGKTSLLDFIRKSNTVARESGGITQHISSFQLTSPNSQPLTFIDTPGHAAFASMRQRGSKLADIAVLVVAGNDGIMPQTKQSIQFIKEAGIPFIVAINKSDLPTFEPDRVKTQLTEMEIVVEDYGGNVPTVNISAKTGSGVPELLELINLISQLNPPQADPDGEVQALVLESKLDGNKGPVSTVVVKNGQLDLGKILYQSDQVGKVKSLIDSAGIVITRALPSMPVEIIGLTQIVDVGSVLYSSPNPVHSKSRQPATSSPSSKDSINIILKTDFQGSLEAILGSLPEGINVISHGSGPVTDTDIDTAKTSSATVISFNAKIPSLVAKLAEVEKVAIVSFKIIYELFDYLENRKSPTVVEEIIGSAEVLAEFNIDGDKIAGCRCNQGVLSRSDQVKIVRGGQTVAISKIRSLRLGKSTVEKVKSGSECGIFLSPSVDFKLQDSIIAFTTHDSPRPQSA